MVLKIYLTIISYTLLGAICGIFVSRKKNGALKKDFWLKFRYYFMIINVVFASIVFHPIYFHYLSVLIIVAGYIELMKLFINSGFVFKRFFIFSIIVYSIFATGFYFFGLLKMENILFTFIVLSVFDSFSQISGQLFGKRKIVPTISPNKTFGGFIGGAISALVTSILLAGLLNIGYRISVFYGAAIVVSAFAGDIFASLYKRKYLVKDFSNALPGQGGFIDRFDSMIASGSLIYLLLAFF